MLQGLEHQLRANTFHVALYPKKKERLLVSHPNVTVVLHLRVDVALVEILNSSRGKEFPCYKERASHLLNVFNNG